MKKLNFLKSTVVIISGIVMLAVVSFVSPVKSKNYSSKNHKSNVRQITDTVFMGYDVSIDYAIYGTGFGAGYDVLEVIRQSDNAKFSATGYTYNNDGDYWVHLYASNGFKYTGQVVE
jgi:hypothetical protein